MVAGATLRIVGTLGDLLITQSGARYRLGPMPHEHIPAHAGVSAGDVLVAAIESGPRGDALVSVLGGCGCRFLIRPG